jgi:hypothetical protein
VSHIQGAAGNEDFLYYDSVGGGVRMHSESLVVESAEKWAGVEEILYLL